MKRAVGIFLIGFIFFGFLNAEPVSKEEAKEFAVRFVELYADSDSYSPSEVISYNLENGKEAYHFVLLEPTGWIMVAADDVLKPVIGYSFNNQFVPMEEWEESARVWFNKVDNHIQEILSKPGLKVNNEWKEIFRESYKKSAQGTAVEPFIDVKWNQGSGWNRFCPEDEEGPGGHAYVGCVAVCMAQAMSVYKYPAQPKGEHGYSHDKYGYIYVNYDNQKPYNWSSMSNTSSDDENARLLYHLAVGVNMGFGADGSGAYTSTTPSVLKNYFGYSESLKYISRSSYSDQEWKQILIDELVQGRPLIYSGDGNDGQAGHAFNIDGVGADGTYFHLNWGWSGSANGYYTLDALNPNSYNFSFDQAAVVGIKPPSAGPYDITLSSLSVYDLQPEGSFVSLVEVADELENNVYSYELKGRFNVLLDDYGSADFYIENDSLKTLKVFDSEDRNSEPVIIEVTDTAGNFFRKEFTITIKKYYFGPTELSLSDSVVQEGKNSGYFVGVLEIEDDIEDNNYNFSTVGGYQMGNFTDADCFTVRNDSVFTNMMFHKSEGNKYYFELSVTDDYDHILKKVFTIQVTENVSGGTAVQTEEVLSSRIYPNPAHNYLTVELDQPSTYVKFDLYSITGQKCMSCTINPGSKVDLSHLENGIYMAVINADGVTSKQKLIISH